MKALGLILIALAWSGCNRDIENKEAVRQGVVDYLSSRSNLSVGSMKVDVRSVSFRKDEADALVSFNAKGSNSGGMEMRYTLEKKGSKWVVKSRAGTGQNPHGGAIPERPGEGGGEPVPGGQLPGGHPPLDGGNSRK